MGDIAKTVIFLILYFLPTLIAALRAHDNLKMLALINLFLGWTIGLWLLTFAWSFFGDENKQITKVGQ